MRSHFCFWPVGANLDILVNGHAAIATGGCVLPAPSADEIMRKIATRYLEVSPPENKEDLQNFLSYLKDFRMTIGPIGVSSLRITVNCTRLEDLEELWRAYTTGALNEAAEKYLVTDEVLRQYKLTELRLTTFIDEEEYRRCKEQLKKCEGNHRSKYRKSSIKPHNFRISPPSPPPKTQTMYSVYPQFGFVTAKTVPKRRLSLFRY